MTNETLTKDTGNFCVHGISTAYVCAMCMKPAVTVPADEGVLSRLRSWAMWTSSEHDGDAKRDVRTLLSRFAQLERENAAQLEKLGEVCQDLQIARGMAKDDRRRLGEIDTAFREYASLDDDKALDLESLRDLFDAARASLEPLAVQNEVDDGHVCGVCEGTQCGVCGCNPPPIVPGDEGFDRFLLGAALEAFDEPFDRVAVRDWLADEIRRRDEKAQSLETSG